MAALSAPPHEINDSYDVVVVGTGYGGSIAASRLARAGHRVCVLERGAEFGPGEFPRTGTEAAKQVRVNNPGGLVGNPDGLYEFHRDQDMTVLVGSGLGGTSLINAGVALRPDPRIFADERWPGPLREAGALDDAFEQALAMLTPAPVPEGLVRLPKTRALETTARSIGATFGRPPLTISFVAGPNAAGVRQAACIGCGDCTSGCNYGAKNSTSVNYLPDARRHGAEIFTGVRVRWVQRSGSDWLVHYRPAGYELGCFGSVDLFVRARTVVLAAGSLGSTEILLRSADRGLAVSARLGHGFTSNGDVMSFAYNCADDIGGVGFGDADPRVRPVVGPCITGLADLRDHPDAEQGIVVQDGTIPGVLRPILAEALIAAAALHETDPGVGTRDQVRKTAGVLRSVATGRGAVDRTLTYLVMAHDAADGRMHLVDDRLRIDWPHGGADRDRGVHDRLLAATAVLGGTYVLNPIASRLLGRDHITVHPLGGAPMAEDASRGVVDHKGRVFAGRTGSAVHDGLYVCDGSVVPRSLGINPLLTISALAERCAALLVADRGPAARAERPDPPTPIPAARAPGGALTFAERMSGVLQEGGGRRSPFSITMAVSIDDVDRFVADDHHTARLLGSVDAPGLSPDRMTVSDGALELLVDDRAAPGEPRRSVPGARRMTYRMTLTTTDGARFLLHGDKNLDNERGSGVWADTTTLQATVREAGEPGTVRGTAVLRIRLADVARQLTTMRAGDDALRRKAEVLARFAAHFAGSIIDAYARSASPAPSTIRPYTLDGVRDAEITTHWLQTADGLVLRLLRFQRGSGRSAVLITHGLTTSVDMFVMPEHDNLVTYLLDAGFEVWALDTRLSNRYDYNRGTLDDTLDDCALSDFPPAVDTIRRHVGDAPIHVIAHCLGSTAFTMSLFGKAVNGITSVVANSVALTPRIPWWSSVKLAVVPELLPLVGIPELDPRWGESSWLNPRKLFSTAVSWLHPECDEPACHMLSLMWGTGWPAMYRHENMDPITHQRVRDLFGGTGMSYYRHVRAMVRAGRAVRLRPGEGRYRALPRDYLEHAGDIATPILFSTGVDNKVFTDSNLVCYRTLRELGCTQHEFAMFDGYGHQDVFMGKHAARDTFPRMVEFLRRHDPGPAATCDTRRHRSEP